MKKLVVVVEPTKTGYSTYLPEIDGVASVGSTLDEISDNIKEAVMLYQEELNIEENFKLEYRFSIEAFFKLFKSINISALADKSNINASLLRQYAKGIKHPSVKQAKKIEQSIHKLGEELTSIRF